MRPHPPVRPALSLALLLGACAPDPESVDTPTQDSGGAEHLLDTHFDADPAIIPAHESDCTNGEDDDQDGDTDCYDEDCQGTDACVEICDDGIDNDLDGRVDCYDRDCRATGACAEICDDGIDNDLDGYIDCYDSNCRGTDACVEICDDGIDNDADRRVDCYDEDCAGAAVCVEVCDDGLDNDADGLLDCEDGDCAGAAVCVEVCDDGVDNDVDGLVDFWDDDCRDGVTAARLHVSGAGAASFRVSVTRSYGTFCGSWDVESTRRHRELEAHSVSGTAGFFNSAASTWSTCAWSVGRIQVTSRWYRRTSRFTDGSGTRRTSSSGGGTPIRSSVTTTGACPYPMTAVLPPIIWHSSSHRSQWMARLATTSSGIEGWYIGSFGATPTTSTSTTWTGSGWGSVGWGHDRRYTGQILAGDTVSVSFP